MTLDLTNREQAQNFMASVGAAYLQLLVEKGKGYVPSAISCQKDIHQAMDTIASIGKKTKTKKRVNK